MRWQLGFLGGIAVLLLAGMAWAAEPVAVITEIQMGKGKVEVKAADEADWKAPKALQALRPGDQVRASDDAKAVLVFTGGRGTQSVTKANSPFAVQAPTAEAGTEKVRTLVAGLTQFLMGKQKEPQYVALSVRKIREAPVPISPRQTKLFPGNVIFEWDGAGDASYQIRLKRPDGALLWKQADLPPGQPVEYPENAPALHPGVRYRWEVLAKGQHRQRAEFEVLSGSETRRVLSSLALLEPTVLPEYPESTVILMRAGLLFQEELFYEARRELLAGIAAHPEEASLHLFLAHVYDRIGLREQAAAEVEKARALESGKR